MEKFPETTATYMEYYAVCSYYALHTLSALVPLILMWRRKTRFREVSACDPSTNRRSHNRSWFCLPVTGACQVALVVRNLPANVGDARNEGLIPGSGRFPGEGIGYPLQWSWASLVAQLVKNPPAMQETWVRSLGWEDPLEKGKATHSSVLAWRIPWTV